MLGIYVTKTWVQTIGNAADLILIEGRQLSGDYVILLASERNLNFAGNFVAADLCRHPSTDSERGSDFVHAKIPAGVIAAIFDFTEAESKKVGFNSGT
jgi:hypothetical protein